MEPDEVKVPAIKPTVGRMVYFKTRGSADGVYPPMDFAAIITRVHTDSCVNLVTFGDSGMRFEHSVNYGDKPGQWDWMPFQKDQAARLAPGTPIAQPAGQEPTVA